MAPEAALQERPVALDAAVAAPRSVAEAQQETRSIAGTVSTFVTRKDPYRAIS